VAAALATVLLLSGCGLGADPEVDEDAVRAGLTTVDGVTDVTTGFASTGTPWSYGLTTEVAVDDAGLADLDHVLDVAIVVVAVGSTGWSTYRFTVVTADASSPTGDRQVAIEDELSPGDVPGTLLGGSLTLTPDQMRQAVADRPARTIDRDPGRVS